MPNRVVSFRVGDRVRTRNSPDINRDMVDGVEFTIGRLDEFAYYGPAQAFAYWPRRQDGAVFPGLVTGGVWHGELELVGSTNSETEVTLRQGTTVEVEVVGKFYTYGKLEIVDGEVLLVIDPDNFPDLAPVEDHEDYEEDG